MSCTISAPVSYLTSSPNVLCVSSSLVTKNSLLFPNHDRTAPAWGLCSSCSLFPECYNSNKLPISFKSILKSHLVSKDHFDKLAWKNATFTTLSTWHFLSPYHLLIFLFYIVVSPFKLRCNLFIMFIVTYLSPFLKHEDRDLCRNIPQFLQILHST